MPCQMHFTSGASHWFLLRFSPVMVILMPELMSTMAGYSLETRIRKKEELGTPLPPGIVVL